jgi:hypothetical protein
LISKRTTIKSGISQPNMVSSPARLVAMGGGEFKELAWRQGNKSQFVDTIDRQHTLAASRFAGIYSRLLPAIALCAPVGTTAHPLLSKKMTITLPSIC